MRSFTDMRLALADPARRSRRTTRTTGSPCPTTTRASTCTTSTTGSGYLQETLVRRPLGLSRSLGAEPPGVSASGRRPCRWGRRTTSAYPGPVLRIDRATYDAIVAHAKRDHPDEACGVVAGPEGSDRPERFVPMVNAAGSPTFYEFDSTDLLRSTRRWTTRRGAGGRLPLAHRDRGVPVAHRHRPGAGARTRTTCWCRTREHGNSDGPVEFRSFRIVDGDVTEEEVDGHRRAEEQA